MTLNDHITAGLRKAAESRLAKLIELNAPPIIIDGVKRQLTKDCSIRIKTGDPTDLLDREFLSVEKFTGRSGKAYYVYQTPAGPVSFFPQGRFGPFVTVTSAN